MEQVTFYFSFRSPFAWLAYHRLPHAFDGLAVQVERVPVFPPANARPPLPPEPKLSYLYADAARTAQAYGLTARWPERIDTDWMRPHAAWYAAADAGGGDAFALALYAAWFSDGRDVADDAVLRAAAATAGVDGAAAVHAADDPAVRQRVVGGMRRALADGVFGVPYFVYGAQRFWGNDRLEWLVRGVRQRLGMPVPDLGTDALARPC